ncbi:putative MFS transporter [Brevibacterium sanguinis]|uniref:MFS transporter n=2 Tax=Brevibacterium TaxID=1696 RepID=A0ABX9GTM1_9MICO|nr:MULTISPECIES: MFS transporter [Brevibacterium]RBP65013.1 putative MFS transporter [Brevibacterium sanguinis]RBP71276.1 putative MFS transporter [Brevibacterium celere]
MKPRYGDDPLGGVPAEPTEGPTAVSDPGAVSAPGSVPVDEAPLNRLVALVAIAAFGGIFVDGYILGVIGGAVGPASAELGLSALGQGLIASSALIGIFVSGLFFGRVADRFGRKPVFFWNLVGFVVLSVAQLFVSGTWDLVALRLGLGLLIGVEYAVGTALLAEFTPRRHRSVLLGSIAAFWFVGFISAFFVSHVWAEDAWRSLLASSAIPALIVLIIRFGLPESPRWLQSKGRTEEAQRIITSRYGPQYALPAQVEEPKASGLREFFRETDWRVIVYSGLFWFCQVGPLFAIFTFITPVLEQLGLAGGFGSDLLMNGIQLAGAGLGLWLLWLLPRRTFVIWTFAIMVVLLVYLGLATGQPALLTFVVFGAFVLIITASNSVQYVYPPEMYETRFRSTGVGFSAAISRIGAAGATYLFPVTLEHLGVTSTLLIAAAFPAVGLIASLLWAPETKYTALDTETIVAH